MIHPDKSLYHIFHGQRYRSGASIIKLFRPYIGNDIFVNSVKL